VSFLIYTDSSNSFSLYTGLVLVNFIFYSIWFGLSELKYYIIKSIHLYRNKSHGVELNRKNNAYAVVCNEEGNPIIDESGVFF
jgi:hypothetical protein